MRKSANKKRSNITKSVSNVHLGLYKCQLFWYGSSHPGMVWRLISQYVNKIFHWYYDTHSMIFQFINGTPFSHLNYPSPVAVCPFVLEWFGTKFQWLFNVNASQTLYHRISNMWKHVNVYNQRHKQTLIHLKWYKQTIFCVLQETI